MGSRYGVTIRKKEQAAIKSQKTKYNCPRCGKQKLTRKGFALWQCSSCDLKMAGGAYSPETGPGTISKKTVESKREA